MINSSQNTQCNTAQLSTLTAKSDIIFFGIETSLSLLFRQVHLKEKYTFLYQKGSIGFMTKCQY